MKQLVFLVLWCDEDADEDSVARRLAAAGMTIDLLTKTRGRFFKLFGRMDFRKAYDEAGMIELVKMMIRYAGVKVTDLEYHRGKKVEQ